MTAEAGPSPSPLRELLRSPLYWHWELATSFIRLTGIMIPFAYVFISVDLRGGPGLGGTMLAASLIAAEISAPFAGRLIDRKGILLWGPLLMFVGGVGQFMVAAAFLADAPAWALIGLVVVMSVITSGTGGTTQALLGRAVPERLLSPAFAVDASLLEACVVSAPFLVTACLLFSPVGALFVTGGLTFLCALLVLALARRPQMQMSAAEREEEAGEAAPAADIGRPQHLWRNRRFIFWLLVGLSFGYLIGTADIGALPLSLAFGQDKLQASIMIGALAAASATAGLTYAWASKWFTIGPTVQATLLLAGMAASGLVIALSSSVTVAIIGYAALGICVAPINTVRQRALVSDVPSNRMVEAFSTMNSLYGMAYAATGIMVGILTPSWLIATGSFTAIAGLLFASVLIGQRRPAAAVTAPAAPAAQPQDA